MADRNGNQTGRSRTRVSAAGRSASRDGGRRKGGRGNLSSYERPPLWEDEGDLPPEEETSRQRGTYAQRRASAGKKRWAVIGVLAFVIVLCAAAAYLLLTSTYFVVSDIQLKGVNLVDSQEILQYSGIEVGDNILLINTDSVASKVASHPMIDAAKVERSFPQTVIITVAERAPRAAIQTVSQYIIVDENLNIINIAAQPPNTDIPVVEGVLAVDVQPGEALTLDNATQREALNTILTTLYSANALYLVDRINVGDTNDIKLYNGDSLVIEVGDYSNMESKIMWISTMLPRLIEQGYSSGTLRVGTGRDYSFVSDQTPSATQIPVETPVPDETPEPTSQPDETPIPGE